VSDNLFQALGGGNLQRLFADLTLALGDKAIQDSLSRLQAAIPHIAGHCTVNG